MRRKVVITGSGTVAPRGDTPARLHAALLAPEDGPEPAELFRTERLVGGWALEVRSFRPEAYLGNRNLRPLDRTSRLLTCAAQLALRDSDWSAARLDEEDVGLVVGTMFCSAHTIAEFDLRAMRDGPGYASPMDFANTVINAAAGQAAIWHNLRGVNSTVSAGATSGLQALANATEIIRTGRARAVLAGGVEELCLETFLGFLWAGRLTRGDALPFDARRDGFVLGEGAALLMLEDAELAAARGARVLAEIEGHGACFDCSRGTDEEQAIRAMTRAVRLALSDAGVDTDAIDCVSTSANGSVRGDRQEALALETVFRGRRPGPAVTAVKAVLGEALGASGAMQALTLVEAMRRRTLPGIPGLAQPETQFLRSRACPFSRAMELNRGLVNSVGSDGHCCSVVLKV